MGVMLSRSQVHGASRGLEFVSAVIAADITIRDMSLAKRVEAQRLFRGLSQSALARAISVYPSAINHIESGRTKNIKAETILALANALSVSAYWLETGVGSPAADARLTPEEGEIVSLFRALSPARRDNLLSIARIQVAEQGPVKASPAQPFPKAKQKA